MADTKISNLTAASSVALTDTLPIVQSSTTKESTFQLVYDIVKATLPVCESYAFGDETTAHTTGSAKVSFHMPYAMTLTDVKVSLVTAGTGAALFTVDLHMNGTTVLSTKVTVDATEKTSATAATPPVISVSALTVDALMTVDIDLMDTGGVAAGGKIYLIGTRA
jgi:hypothetical protein